MNRRTGAALALAAIAQHGSISPELTQQLVDDLLSKDDPAADAEAPSSETITSFNVSSGIQTVRERVGAFFSQFGL